MRIETASGQSAMRCTRALLLYETDSRGVQNSEEIAASLHEVARPSENELPMLMPGVPLTTEAMNEIYKKLAGAQKVSRSLAPENLLCCEAGRLIWWTPSARRLIFFDTGNKKFDNEVGGKEVLHPALLFVAEERTLFVFALKSNARPNGKTPLFAAPYFNLYERGAMCAGSGRVPTGCNAKDIPAWEKLFFETNFSHTNRDARKLCRHPGGHDGLWREMARTRNAPKTFPAKYLTPDKRKVEDLLNGRL